MQADPKLVWHLPTKHTKIMDVTRLHFSIRIKGKKGSFFTKTAQ